MTKAERITRYQKIATEGYLAVGDAGSSEEALTRLDFFRTEGTLSPQVESAAAAGRLGLQVQALRLNALSRASIK